jgi:hypothetical protein
LKSAGMSMTFWSARGCANASNASSMWFALGSLSHEAMIIFCTSNVWCWLGRFALHPWIPGSHCVSFLCLYFALGFLLSSGILRFGHFRWLLDTLRCSSTHDPAFAGVLLHERSASLTIHCILFGPLMRVVLTMDPSICHACRRQLAAYATSYFDEHLQ